MRTRTKRERVLSQRSKLLIIACMMLLMVKERGEAIDIISYPAIRRDITPGCSPVHPDLCNPPRPANPYHRGCSKLDRCRSGDLEKKKKKSTKDNKPL